MRIAHLPVAAVAIALLTGCQSPDVGQACVFDLSVPQPVAADYLELGKTECDNLVCIQSPPAPAGSKVANNPYCSKACVTDSDCSSGDTGLVCRDVVLNSDFINTLPPDVRNKYLPGSPFSKYFAAPIPK